MLRQASFIVLPLIGSAMVAIKRKVCRRASPLARCFVSEYLFASNYVTCMREDLLLCAQAAEAAGSVDLAEGEHLRLVLKLLTVQVRSKSFPELRSVLR